MDEERATLIPKVLTTDDEEVVICKPDAKNSWQSTGIQVPFSLFFFSFILLTLFFFILKKILNTMLGSGVLAFPYLLAKCGILLFTFSILFTVSIVLCTSWMLITAGKKKKILNYSKLTEEVFGKNMRQLLNVGIIFSSVGSMLSYLNGNDFTELL